MTAIVIGAIIGLIIAVGIIVLHKKDDEATDHFREQLDDAFTRLEKQETLDVIKRKSIEERRQKSRPRRKTE